MISLRVLAVTVGIVAAFAAGAALSKLGVLAMQKTTYVKTLEPLLVNTEGATEYYHLLPAGTPLYRNASFPEGFDRYIVYVNIKGAFASETVEVDKANVIDPIWAYPVRKQEISELLAHTPISRDDLVTILKARKVTREELAQIVREWKE